ncbi:hypothetical protein NDU88_004384, partial [Pleurodeles waltl]
VPEGTAGRAFTDHRYQRALQGLLSLVAGTRGHCRACFHWPQAPEGTAGPAFTGRRYQRAL